MRTAKWLMVVWTVVASVMVAGWLVNKGIETRGNALPDQPQTSYGMTSGQPMAPVYAMDGGQTGGYYQPSASQWIGYGNLSSMECLRLLDRYLNREWKRDKGGCDDRHDRKDQSVDDNHRPRMSTLLYGFEAPTEENVQRILSKAEKIRYQGRERKSNRSDRQYKGEQ